MEWKYSSRIFDIIGIGGSPPTHDAHAHSEKIEHTKSKIRFICTQELNQLLTFKLFKIIDCGLDLLIFSYTYKSFLFLSIARFASYLRVFCPSLIHIVSGREEERRRRTIKNRNKSLGTNGIEGSALGAQACASTLMLSVGSSLRNSTSYLTSWAQTLQNHRWFGYFDFFLRLQAFSLSLDCEICIL